MLESLNTQEFKYTKLTEEEIKSRGILGRLKGVIADFKNPTRNGRMYSEELWDKVFENPIVKEKLENKTIFGELGHPTDRTETDMEKIAICLSEMPKKGRDGKVYGVFDILPTPNGRILKTLCDYGTTIGVSSRGSGDVEVDFDGQESVNPDSYDFECWDAVILPAVKAARMEYVTECLDKKKYNKTLREKLNEELDKATDDNKKIMQETLYDLHLMERLVEPSAEILEIVEDEISELNFNIVSKGKGMLGSVHYQILSNEGDKTKDDLEHLGDLLSDFTDNVWINYKTPITFNMGLQDDGFLSAGLDVREQSITDKSELDLKDNKVEEDIKQECNSEDCSDTEVKTNEAVEINEAKVVDELQEALKQNRELESKVIELNEQLSVCYAKDAETKELSAKLNSVSKLLSKTKHQNDALNEKISQLTEELNESNNTLNKAVDVAKKLRKAYDGTKSNLNEQLSSNKEKYNQALETTKNLNENLVLLKKEKESLSEAYATLKKDSEQAKAIYAKKLEKSNKLVEKYKLIATTSVDRYIESQAIRLGVTPNEIKNRLSESYTFNDIDSICEDIQNTRINLGRLPFQTLNLNEGINARISSHKKEQGPVNEADIVDADLLNLAKLIKYN